MSYEHSAKTANWLRPMTKRQWRRYRWTTRQRIQPRPDTLFQGRQLVVWRIDGGTDFPWYHLQQIKNHALGEDVVCVEVYPNQAHLVNEQNCRHLWEMPEGSVPTLWE